MKACLREGSGTHQAALETGHCLQGTIDHRAVELVIALSCGLVAFLQAVVTVWLFPVAKLRWC